MPERRHAPGSSSPHLHSALPLRRTALLRQNLTRRSVQSAGNKKTNGHLTCTGLPRCAAGLALRLCARNSTVIKKKGDLKTTKERSCYLHGAVPLRGRADAACACQDLRPIGKVINVNNHSKGSGLPTCTGLSRCAAGLALRLRARNSCCSLLRLAASWGVTRDWAGAACNEESQRMGWWSLHVVR